MSKSIIFDANFLYENKNFEQLFKNKKENEEFFVTDLVINEIISKNDRRLKELYDKYKSIVDDQLNKMYFKLVNKIDLDNMYEQSSKKTHEYFKNFFKENIIYGYSKEKMYEDLMGRVRFKVPPFFDEDNSSDKGFKDTLIWMSLMNYCDSSSCDDFIIVTNDKGFLRKHKESLILEFSKRFPTKKIDIITSSEFTKLHNPIDGLEDKDKVTSPIIGPETKKQNKLTNDQIEEYRRKAYSFFNYTVTEDFYNSEEYEKSRFVLNRKPTVEEITDLMAQILEDRENYIFHDSVDIKEYLVYRGFTYVKKNSNIPIDEFNDFLNCYEDVKTNYPRNLEAYINYIIEIFCDIKTVNVEDEKEDLPF
ncbi:MAG: PIN domain-containing protein [Candidatus Cloacimonetes bacterium]|nr:PIN domain-containing protein [Candidatus Cloacimonadota bacterium]